MLPFMQGFVDSTLFHYVSGTVRLSSCVGTFPVVAPRLAAVLCRRAILFRPPESRSIIHLLARAVTLHLRQSFYREIMEHDCTVVKQKLISRRFVFEPGACYSTKYPHLFQTAPS